MAHGLSPKPLRVTVACSSWTPNRSMVRPGGGVPFPPAFWNISSSSTSWSSRGERVRLKGVAWNWWRRLSSVLSSRPNLERWGGSGTLGWSPTESGGWWNTGRNSPSRGCSWRLKTLLQTGYMPFVMPWSSKKIRYTSGKFYFTRES